MRKRKGKKMLNEERRNRYIPDDVSIVTLGKASHMVAHCLGCGLDLGPFIAGAEDQEFLDCEMDIYLASGKTYFALRINPHWCPPCRKAKREAEKRVDAELKENEDAIKSQVEALKDAEEAVRYRDEAVRRIKAGEEPISVENFRELEAERKNDED